MATAELVSCPKSGRGLGVRSDQVRVFFRSALDQVRLPQMYNHFHYSLLLQVVSHRIRRPVHDIEHSEHEREEDARHDINPFGSSGETGQPLLANILIGVSRVDFAAFHLLVHWLWHDLRRHSDPCCIHWSCRPVVRAQQRIHGTDQRHERLLRIPASGPHHWLLRHRSSIRFQAENELHLP